MVNQIYPPELRLNNLKLLIPKPLFGFEQFLFLTSLVHQNNMMKCDDFDFDIVKFPIVEW